MQADNETNKQDIADIKTEQIEQNATIERLETDNTQNKVDIAEIKEEQIAQNTKIETLESENETNKQDILDIQTKNTEQDTNIQNNAENIELLKQENVELKAKDLELEAENERLREDLNSLPSVSEEGENITLNGTAEARFKKFEISGNSKQKTREGYNVLKNEATSQSINGIDFTVNEDKSVKANGTATANAQLFLLGDISGTNLVLTLKANISYKNISGVDLSYRKTNGDYGKIINNSTITPDSDMLIGAVYIQINSGTTVNSTYYPMIIEGTENKPYEQYGVMPSTEFESPIQNVAGNANVTICNKNLVKEMTGAYNGTVANDVATSIALNGFGYIRTNFEAVRLKSNTTYYISVDVRLSKGSYNSGLNTINLHNVTSVSEKTVIQNPTLSSSFKRYCFSYKSDVEQTIKGVIVQLENAENVVIEVKNMMISTSSNYNYIKHQEQSFTLNLGDLKLCKTGDYKDYIWRNKTNNKWYKHETIKEVILGTQNYYINGTLLHLNLLLIFGESLVNGYSTKLVANRWTAQNNMYAHTDANKIFVSDDGTKASLYNSDLKTKKQWDEWFSENPSVLYGVLANPIDKEITDETLISQLEEIEKTAKSYGEQTHIFSTDEIGSFFEVEAKADIQTMFNNLQAQILAGEV